MESFAIVLTIFILSIFVGYEVITKVPPTLHTPLMSGSNAISGIISDWCNYFCRNGADIAYNFTRIC